MANHRSAKKRARQAIRRAAANTAGKSRVKTAVKAFRGALSDGGAEAALAPLAAATRTLQREASRGVLHARTAARRVGRLAAAHHRAQNLQQAGSTK